LRPSSSSPSLRPRREPARCEAQSAVTFDLTHLASYTFARTADQLALPIRAPDRLPNAGLPARCSSPRRTLSTLNRRPLCATTKEPRDLHRKTSGRTRAIRRRIRSASPRPGRVAWGGDRSCAYSQVALVRHIQRREVPVAPARRDRAAQRSPTLPPAQMRVHVPGCRRAVRSNSPERPTITNTGKTSAASPGLPFGHTRRRRKPKVEARFRPSAGSARRTSEPRRITSSRHTPAGTAIHNEAESTTSKRKQSRPRVEVITGARAFHRDDDGLPPDGNGRGSPPVGRAEFDVILRG
jgi:hypothetical protein